MKKMGFHYYPDTDHYRAADFERWLPKLLDLKADFIVLQAPVERAVPEPFIIGLKQAQIEPILHFSLPADQSPGADDLALLLETYARWGVKYVIFFDRPNNKDSWSSSNWTQTNLVECFLDVFLPFAEAAVMVGLVPIFPPLEQGGDYWDTTFLRDALEGLQRRASETLLKRLILSADGCFNQHSLDWGSGGPERWPEAQPYRTPDSSEDHRGFRIVDWYLMLSETVLEKKLPILLLNIHGEETQSEKTVDQLMRSVDLLAGVENQGSEPLPEELIGGSYWLLTADDPEISAQQVWIRPDGTESPAAVRLLEKIQPSKPKTAVEFLIPHYLLLPSFDWGVSDWHLEVTHDFIKRHQPTIGFSLDEASRAEQVTVLGGKEYFTEKKINQLRSKGCLVRRVTGDGTNIASQLAAL
jgi:hypothetical protein